MVSGAGTYNGRIGGKLGEHVVLAFHSVDFESVHSEVIQNAFHVFGDFSNSRAQIQSVAPLIGKLI